MKFHLFKHCMISNNVLKDEIEGVKLISQALITRVFLPVTTV